MKRFFVFILVILLSSCNTGLNDEDQSNKDNQYTITVTTLIGNGEAITDKTTAKVDEEVTLNFYPKIGYEFDFYMISGKTYTNNTFVMPESNVTVFVCFKECIYDIVINDKITNGQIIPLKETAKYNEQISLEVIADEGYKLESLYINDKLFDDLIFNMPNNDVYITAIFTLEIPDNGCEHDYQSTVLKEASCEEDGILEYRCSGCNDVYTNTIDKTGHNYNANYECVNCKDVLEKTLLYEIFGTDIDIYTNNEENPYNIDLDIYGSDVNVYFYEPNLSVLTDPYKNVNKTNFYNNYERATTYEDAYFRTQHYLMSGDITPQHYLPVEEKIVEDGKAVRVSTANYVLDTKGNYIAYVPNVYNCEEYIIFYGAAYTSLNDVASYLLAFGETPANQIADKYDYDTALYYWGEYGRVNDSYFSGDTSKFPYEPELPNIMGNNKIRYNEMDFGTTGGYINSNSVGTYYNQKLYNDGSSIDRGAARFVYVSDYNIKNIDKRYVFYTYNHYNDFQEYLNYHNGWGYRFGNQSAGNEYCGGKKDYEKLNCVSPTSYPITLLKKYAEIE